MDISEPNSTAYIFVITESSLWYGNLLPSDVLSGMYTEEGEEVAVWDLDLDLDLLVMRDAIVVVVCGVSTAESRREELGRGYCMSVFMPLKLLL